MTPFSLVLYQFKKDVSSYHCTCMPGSFSTWFIPQFAPGAQVFPPPQSYAIKDFPIPRVCEQRSLQRASLASPSAFFFETDYYLFFKALSFPTDLVPQGFFESIRSLTFCKLHCRRRPQGHLSQRAFSPSPLPSF